MILSFLQYFLPIVFIGVGSWVKKSKDPAFAKSKKIAVVLIILGVITLVGRIVLDFFVNK